MAHDVVVIWGGQRDASEQIQRVPRDREKVTENVSHGV